MSEGRQRNPLGAVLRHPVIATVVGGLILAAILGTIKHWWSSSHHQTSTTTTLSPSPTNPVTNQTVTLTATVTANSGTATPAGTVQFDNGGSPIAGCSAHPLSGTGTSATATCQTSFAASTSPESLIATYTPSTGSGFQGSASTSPVALTVTTTPKTTPTTPTTPQAGTSVWGPNDVTLAVNRHYPLDHGRGQPLDSCDSCVWVGDAPGAGIALQAANVTTWTKRGQPTYNDCTDQLNNNSSTAASLIEGPYTTGVQPGGWLCATSQSGEILVLQYKGADSPGNDYYFSVTAWPKP